MRIPTRARYALRLMIDLARHQAHLTPVALRAVAERQRISKRYLEQLTTGLRHAGLVGTARGRRGGYRLRRAPQEITVAEIISASIGEVNVVQCVRAPDACPRSDDCPSRAMWLALNNEIDRSLSKISLADLQESAKNPVLDSPSPCTSASEQPGPG